MTETRLQVGDTAPDFTAATDTGEFSLAALRGSKVILYFYPAAMTPGCTTEACDFNESLSTLKSAGYEVVGVSKDDPATLAKFREKEGLSYTLVSDPDLTVQKAYAAFGEKTMYGKTVTGSIRSTFAIDEQGTIEFAAYNVRAKGHVAKLRRDLGIDPK